MVREVRHEVEIERQFLRLQNFEQSKDKFAFRCRDEIVGVLDTRFDAVKIGQRADGIIREPDLQFIAQDAGEDGHVFLTLSSEFQ